MKFLTKILLCTVLIADQWTLPCAAQDDDDDAEIALLKEQMNVILTKINTLAKKRRGQKKGHTHHQKNPSPRPLAAAPKPQETLLKTPPTQELPKPIVTNTKEQMALKIFGQINRLAAWRSNGKKERLEHLDSNASSTRINFTAEGKLNDDFTTQGVLELEFPDFNASHNTKIAAATEGGNFGSMRPRRLEAIFTSKQLGTLFVGLGSMAADNTSEVDYSETSMASNGSEGPFNLGGIQFYNKTTHSQDRRIGSDAYNNFDGESRANRIRYDTPEILGFILGGSHSNKDQIDAALKFAGRIDSTKIGAAFGYSYPPFLKSNGEGRPNRQFNGSFSVLFPCGLSLGGAGGVRKFTHNLQDDRGIRRRNSDFWFAKLGYQFNCLSLGKTALAVDLARARRHALIETDFTAANSERLWSYAFTGVQNIDKVATELYTIFRVYELHRRKESFRKAFVGVLGARVKF